MEDVLAGPLTPERHLADVIQFHLHQGKGKAMPEKRTNF